MNDDQISAAIDKLTDRANTAEATLAKLEQAVRDFLDLFYDDDIAGSRPSWPSRLEEMVSWQPPHPPGSWKVTTT